MADRPPAEVLPSLHFDLEVDADVVDVGVETALQLAVVVEVVELVVEGAEECSNIFMMPSFGLLLAVVKLAAEEIPSLIVSPFCNNSSFKHHLINLN